VKFLWISNHSPFQIDFGGGQRSNLIYRTLREIAEVDVLLLARDGIPQEAPEAAYGAGDGALMVVEPTPRGRRPPWGVARPLKPALVDRVAYNLGRRVLEYSPNPGVMRAVEEMAARTGYDLLVGRHLKNSGQAGLLRLRRAIVDVDDNEIDVYRWIIDDPATSTIRRRVLRSRVRTLQTLIPRVVADGPELWVTKEEDLASPGLARARVLPNIPFQLAQEGGTPEPEPYVSSKTILFVGMLGYEYNARGLDWFLSEVWPQVRASVPEARFCIVGSRLPDPARARWSASPGVEVVGFVDDLAVAYRDCSFVIAPIWTGGGTNIKTLEAMLYGRTCVVTRPSYKGFAQTLPEDEVILVADSADQMIAHCVELLGDGDRCRSMGLAGAAAVTKHYSFASFRETVLETVEAALRG
jgi:glycosyltransferase involved in cell wall biosynthesis